MYMQYYGAVSSVARLTLFIIYSILKCALNRIDVSI